MATHSATKITPAALAAYGARLEAIGQQYKTWAAALIEENVQRVIAYEAAGLDKSVQMVESALHGAIRGWTDERDNRLRESADSPTGFEWVDPANELKDWEQFPPISLEARKAGREERAKALEAKKSPKKKGKG